MPWSELRLLAIVMLINVIDGMDNQLLPLSIMAIGADWGAAPAQFSLAVSAGFVGAMLGTPLGGWLGDRGGRKIAILAGMALFATCTMAMAACRGTGELALARLLAGIGLGTMLPPMLALVVEGVAPQRKGTAIALTMLAMPLGLVLSGLVIPRLIAHAGWQETTALCGGAALAMALVAWFALPGSAVRAPLVPRVALAALDLRRTGPLMAALCLVYIAMSAALSWMPPFAIRSGLSPVAAGLALSIWSLSGMAGTLLAGELANRLGAARAARLAVAGLALGTAAGALILVGGDHAPSLYAAAALGGLFASGAITACYAAASECFPEAVRSSGMSVVTLAGKCGGVLGGASGAALLTLPSLAAFFAVLGAIALGGRAFLSAIAPVAAGGETLPAE
jgi:AAHS family 4-hydroxybenzoate transporter-like MFS transporter